MAHYDLCTGLNAGFIVSETMWGNMKLSQCSFLVSSMDAPPRTVRSLIVSQSGTVWTTKSLEVKRPDVIVTTMLTKLNARFPGIEQKRRKPFSCNTICKPMDHGVNFRLTVLQYPPSRPDLATSDFYLFGPVKYGRRG